MTAPRAIWPILALALQLTWHGMRTPPSPAARALAPAPPSRVLAALSLGDPIALARLLMLGLQSHDDQAGAALGFKRLDYHAVRAWLGRILELDPRGQYPLLAASQLYAAVDDPARTRVMLDFVYQQYLVDPARRWPSLAHATLLARHRLRDLPLARRYASAIRTHGGGADVPAWARELEVFILEDMNELDSARALVGALLASGQVDDPRELAFLERRLRELEARVRE